MICICFFFFFQAEDGIRDLVRSRGLGDVYKRQVRMLRLDTDERLKGEIELLVNSLGRVTPPIDPTPVSYTHLTLPTSDLV